MLITRRRIPLDHYEAYVALWHAVRRAASAAGARAWIFTAERTGGRFVEFIEWQSDAQHTVLDRRDVARPLDELNSAFPAEDAETWVEAKM